MAKLIVESDYKSVLSSHGYHKADYGNSLTGSEIYKRTTGHSVHIKPDGSWSHYDPKGKTAGESILKDHKQLHTHLSNYHK